MQNIQISYEISWHGSTLQRPCSLWKKVKIGKNWDRLTVGMEKRYKSRREREREREWCAVDGHRGESPREFLSRPRRWSSRARRRHFRYHWCTSDRGDHGPREKGSSRQLVYTVYTRAAREESANIGIAITNGEPLACPKVRATPAVHVILQHACVISAISRWLMPAVSTRRLQSIESHRSTAYKPRF